MSARTGNGLQPRLSKKLSKRRRYPNNTALIDDGDMKRMFIGPCNEETDKSSCRGIKG